MAILSQVFNPNDIEEEVLPPSGNYLVEVTKSTIKKTKAGTGQYIALTMKVIDGDHEGFTLFDNINFDNPNPKAVAIAQRTLQQICVATGLEELEDTAEIHGIPMTVQCNLKPESGGWPAKLEVKKYMNADVYED